MSLFCQIHRPPLSCPGMKEEDKQRTIDAYNRSAHEFSAKFTKYNEARAVYLDRFLAEFSGSRILDVGAGDGSPALYLKEKGRDVVCIDLSEEMVKIMESRGLDARLMDMERIDFPAESFDGVLALSSLMNLPKADFVKVIARISDLLAPGGVFASFITRGEGEGMEVDARYGGTERWFSYYSFDELKEILAPYFDVLVMEDASTPARPWIFTLAKKK